MTENKKEPEESAEPPDEGATPEKTAADDPRLAGHALQDHDRVRAELDRAAGIVADEHTGNPARSRPDLVPGRRDDAIEEVRKVRAENDARNRARSSVLLEEKVAASTTSGADKFIEITTADGKCFVNTHGEAVLDHDGVVDFQRKLAAAFQATA